MLHTRFAVNTERGFFLRQRRHSASTRQIRGVRGGARSSVDGFTRVFCKSRAAIYSSRTLILEQTDENIRILAHRLSPFELICRQDSNRISALTMRQTKRNEAKSKRELRGHKSVMGNGGKSCRLHRRRSARTHSTSG